MMNVKSQSDAVIIKRADSVPAFSVGLLSSTLSYSEQRLPIKSPLRLRARAIFWRLTRYVLLADIWVMTRISSKAALRAGAENGSGLSGVKLRSFYVLGANAQAN